MSELPTGTVSLLFSDIEGSTALLKRLGPAYAQALDGQRQVLRKAWADHGGTELGTEGDSFYVVFPTAEGAVAAAAQGQRDLAGFEWPGDEQVRVRIGIHTGSPAVHDGAYVGMDVHRAARIAGAAHGGQVLLSSATAELVTHCLPEQVTLKDLGFHQLKDIANPEHLFQIAIDGGPSDFPPPKTLGTTSSLPRPATPLVGRDGELTELSVLLASPEVRLVTLTGPGGSGKTRLAIGVAERLVERFPDGVYFVPLAAVTAADVMWTTIAEILDVPPEGRIPPGFFEHVTHRTAAFVLDNLEQVSGADQVVSELLREAGQAVVIATSRRPLNVAGEHVHAVPPLELPERNAPEEAAQSGAVQLFVQAAQRVKASFTLSTANTAEISELCHRLDGLPLALELAAARTRLLSPAALLARLGSALEIKDTGVDRPSRQRTLRETIAWSHDLLNPTQQAFFRRLGVFSGGADFDAIVAVTADLLDAVDPLDLVADLVDASLATIAEDLRGEPRVGMLETIRAYARDQLSVGEKEAVSARHADHYLQLAEETRDLLFGQQYAEARRWFETEHDNLREALAWTLQPDLTGPAATERTRLALRLSWAASAFWDFSGYNAEARRWLERAVQQAGAMESTEMARCLDTLGFKLQRLGDLTGAHRYQTASVNMSRRLADTSGLVSALTTLATIESERGQPDAARAIFEEALMAARSSEDNEGLGSVLLDAAVFEGSQGDLERFVVLNDEALALAREKGHPYAVATLQSNMACALRLMGEPEKAEILMRSLIPQLLNLNVGTFLCSFSEDYAAVLADLGQHHSAVRLLGSANAMRERNSTPRPQVQEDEIAEPIAKTRGGLTTEEWEAAYQAGCNMTVEEALNEAHAATADKAPTKA